jgi:hypothetical protein
MAAEPNNDTGDFLNPQENQPAQQSKGAAQAAGIDCLDLFCHESRTCKNGFRRTSRKDFCFIAWLTAPGLTLLPLS